MQARTAFYFAGGFLVLWTLVSIVLYSNFKKALIRSFDMQLNTGAYNVAQKTNAFPKIVPLPQGNESFIIVYKNNNTVDTLFKPAKVLFALPINGDSIAVPEGWRTLRLEQSLDNGGSIEVLYSLPSENIERQIAEIKLLIFIVLLLGLICAILLAYWLAAQLLLPVRQVIHLANSININNDTQLLAAPENEDELKDLIVSFNRMLLRIKEQSSRQTAFFASASHELRTPLAIMQTSLQVLLKKQDGEALKNIYDSQLKEVQRLSKMVNDFLLLSELRNGDMQLTKTQGDLTAVINDTIERFKLKAEAKKIKFNISYQPAELSYHLFFDQHKLQIILDNLLDNAVKYSPENNVVTIKIEGSLEKYVISISNKIREDINPQIADVKNEFYHSKPLHGEGFGLGLWIANQLAGMQNIEIYFAIEDKTFFKAVMVLYNDSEAL